MINNDLLYFKNIRKDFNTLYVEDNQRVRSQTSKMLNNLLPNITEASDGLDAIKIYEKHFNDKNLKEFDLIITDIQMPKKNGLEMIKIIRKINKSVLIIIFSAYSNSEYFLEAIKIGVDGYILKPYSIIQINDVLVNTLKKYESKNIINLTKNYQWCSQNKTLKKDKECVKLSKNEIKLFEFLLSLKGSIKASDEIENFVFDDFISNNKRVRNLISRLNNKLETNIIESIYAEGYRIKTIKKG